MLAFLFDFSRVVEIPFVLWILRELFSFRLFKNRRGSRRVLQLIDLHTWKERFTLVFRGLTVQLRVFVGEYW